MTSSPVQCQPLSRAQIEAALRQCPRLPSLRSIDQALRELTQADQRYTSQISEVIRRDPSLTARLLRLVNSVYYGLTTPVKSIEEAVLYLGVRQIRQLAMVTPVIEDFQQLASRTRFPWRRLWQHCIGTAILTRELLCATNAVQEEADYLAGLLHDVGKIAMAATFPEHFRTIYDVESFSEIPLPALELMILGAPHTEIGGLYLHNHHLPELLVSAARYHHEPWLAPNHQRVIAAVQVADLLARHAAIGTSGNGEPVSEEDCFAASGWSILLPGDEAGIESLRPQLKRSLERLPAIVEGLV
jgi:HD-like signal output (HDOD) protein